MRCFVQVSLEALSAFVPPEEREQAMRGAGSSETVIALEEEADIEAEVNEKVVRLSQSYAFCSVFPEVDSY